MSSTVCIEGIKPPDAKWKKMKAVYDSCVEAGLAVPREVEKFFGYGAPDEKGVLVDQDKLGPAVQQYKEEMRDGFEVDLSKLDKDVTLLRFYVSY